MVCNAAATKFMERNYRPVYDEPCLYLRITKDVPTGSANSKKTWESRATSRKHYRKLSRYFRLPDDKKEWKCPDLLTACEDECTQRAGDITLTYLLSVLLRLGVEPNPQSFR